MKLISAIRALTFYSPGGCSSPHFLWLRRLFKSLLSFAPAVVQVPTFCGPGDCSSPYFIWPCQLFKSLLSLVLAVPSTKRLAPNGLKCGFNQAFDCAKTFGGKKHTKCRSVGPFELNKKYTHCESTYPRFPCNPSLSLIKRRGHAGRWAP